MKERDIREIWKSGDNTVDTRLEKDQVERIISAGPKNVISKFVKTLKIEQRLNFVIFLVAMIILFVEQIWISGWAMIVLNVLFYVYYKNLIEKIDSKIVENNVLVYLQEVHELMKKFILHYKLASFVLTLPAYILVIFVDQYDEHKRFDLMEAVQYHEIYIHVVSIIAVFVIAMLLIHLMYGIKAQKIKSLISSLQEEES